MSAVVFWLLTVLITATLASYYGGAYVSRELRAQLAREKASNEDLADSAVKAAGMGEVLIAELRRVDDALDVAGFPAELVGRTAGGHSLRVALLCVELEKERERARACSQECHAAHGALTSFGVGREDRTLVIRILALVRQREALSDELREQRKHSAGLFRDVERLQGAERARRRRAVWERAGEQRPGEDDVVDAEWSLVEPLRLPPPTEGDTA